MIPGNEIDAWIFDDTVTGDIFIGAALAYQRNYLISQLKIISVLNEQNSTV